MIQPRGQNLTLAHPRNVSPDSTYSFVDHTASSLEIAMAVQYHQRDDKQVVDIIGHSLHLTYHVTRLIDPRIMTEFRHHQFIDLEFFSAPATR